MCREALCTAVLVVAHPSGASAYIVTITASSFVLARDHLPEFVAKKFSVTHRRTFRPWVILFALQANMFIRTRVPFARNSVVPALTNLHLAHEPRVVR